MNFLLVLTGDSQKPDNASTLLAAATVQAANTCMVMQLGKNAGSGYQGWCQQSIQEA